MARVFSERHHPFLRAPAALDSQGLCLPPTLMTSSLARGKGAVDIPVVEDWRELLVHQVEMSRTKQATANQVHRNNMSDLGKRVQI